MAWVFIPPICDASPSALGQPGSTLESSSRFQVLESSVWLNGKPARSLTWSRRCVEGSWISLLFGAMPEPSTADRGAAAWMDSSAASRVSRIPYRASDSNGKMSATSGPTPVGSSPRAGPGGSSSRMSAGCSPAEAPNGSGETFTAWASRLRADYLPRQKSAIRRNAKGSSSSPYQIDDTLWPTAQTHNRKSAKAMTASTNNGRRSGGGNSSPPGLEQVAQIFAGHLPQEMREIELPPATRAMIDKMLWNAPTRAMATGGQVNRGGARQGELLLAGQARAVTIAVSSHQGRPTSMPGSKSSPDPLTLNPLFVEWLMGWVEGWTQIALGDSACSETALSLFKLRMRSALWDLALPPPAPPPQLDLFAI